MRTTYIWTHLQDNMGEAIEGCRDETVEIRLTVDDAEGGAETMTEVLNAFQRFLYASGFTWAGPGRLVYLSPEKEVAPYGTMDRLSMATRELEALSEPVVDDRYPEFPNGEFPNECPNCPRDFLHGDYELDN